MFGGFLLLGGRVADYLGHRRLYVSGLILFTAASLAGALAQSGLWLVIARGLQGLGAALVSPAALALLMALFDEGAERSKALGVWAALGGSGGAAGAILGGVLTDGLGWQAVLLVNVPVGAAAVALTPRLLPESRTAAGARGFDLAGAVAVTAGLALLVYRSLRGANLVTLLNTGAMFPMFFFITSTPRMCSATARSSPVWPSCRWRPPSPPRRRWPPG
jgi:MFS family permease